MRIDKGQALVIILLSLAVVLTIVLSILSRTITDIKVSTSGEEAIRAFSAAEAGVEQALIVASDVSNPNLGDASFSADVSGYAEGTTTFNYPINLTSGETATVWFASHNDEGSLSPYFLGNSIKICWGKAVPYPDPNLIPAVEFSVFYDDGTIKIARAALDPNTSGRTGVNKFSPAASAGCQIGDTTYQFSSTVNFAVGGLGITNLNGLLFGRLRILYNSDQNQIVGFDSTGQGNLPSQGLLINSLGQSGESNRRVEVFQAWSETPEIFGFPVFSQGGLVKSQ